jgi:predicted nuclease of predicted toxin-antitoxin system
MRVLLDQNVPVGVRRFLSDHEVQTAYQMGWANLTNGELLSAAERAGYAVLVTADQNITSQQNLSGRLIRLVVLPMNRWSVLSGMGTEIVAMIAGEGSRLTP